MPEKRCERCNAKAQGAYGILDYCAHCSKDLCDDCMAKGCCGHVPADSGEKADGSSEEE
jgi:hypothetical protein